MSERDDYDIIDAPRQPPPRAPIPGNWLLMLVTVAILAFSLGLVVATLANRFGRAAPEPTPTIATPASVIGAQPTLTSTVQAVVTPTQPATVVTPALTATPVVTAAATVTPTALACTAPPDSAFANATFTSYLGCPTGAAAVVWAAWEPFERGGMFWRNDTNQAYAFFNEGEWTLIEQGWAEGQEIPSRGDPPAGLQAPIRGFGYAWATRDDLFNRLGWATTEEKGFCALIQPFERGFALQSSTVEFCQDNLYNTAREPGWPLTQLAVRSDGRWQNPAQVGANRPVDQVVLPPASTADQLATRPENNGRFAAALATPRLDADFSDWSSQWFPVMAIVQGAENYAGAQDLAGAFQVAWSAEGLYLAVRVSDDRYRGGPAGTNQWQGDGLEVNLDRQLQADFANPQADGDDYQVGVSFGADRNELRGYRWLPPQQEGAFTPAGAVVAQETGYAAEFLLPWSLFDMTGSDLAARSFGFMVSLNDNDQDTPAQQTVLSTSPQRTTYNRPDEWGTLILAN